MKQEITNDKPDTLSVEWEMTTTCNFSCWYCNPSYHDGKYRWPDFDTHIDFFNDLADQNKHRQIYLNILGGEPTLWPRLPEFLSKLSDNIEHVITTNGSRTLRWWKDNHNTFQNVALTFHPIECNVQHFFDVIEFLDSILLNSITVYVMLVDQQIDKCIDLIERLEASNFNISLTIKHLSKRIGVDNNKIKLNNNDQIVQLTNRSFVRRKTNFKTSNPTICYLNGQQINHRKLELEGKDNFNGWTCTIGLSRLHVTASGDIYRGTCCNISKRGKIGNVKYSSNFSDLKPVVCNINQCGCRDELILHKWKTN